MKKMEYNQLAIGIPKIVQSQSMTCPACDSEIGRAELVVERKGYIGCINCLRLSK